MDNESLGESLSHLMSHVTNPQLMEAFDGFFVSHRIGLIVCYIIECIKDLNQNWFMNTVVYIL